MSLTGALLLVFAAAALLLISLFFNGAFDKQSTSAEQFLESYVKRELKKAQAGAINAEQWAKELVAKAEKHFR